MLLQLLRLTRAGVKQPLKEIAAICKKHKVFFHTDAAQSVGKVRRWLVLQPTA